MSKEPSLKDLKKMLKELGEPVSGKKAELKKRLETVTKKVAETEKTDRGSQEKVDAKKLESNDGARAPKISLQAQICELHSQITAMKQQEEKRRTVYNENTVRFMKVANRLAQEVKILKQFRDKVEAAFSPQAPEIIE